MPGLAAAVAAPLRLRARVCVVLACLATALCLASIASAQPSVQTKTRVRAFDVAPALSTWLHASATARTRLGFPAAQSEVVLGSPHAARGGAKAAYEIAKAGGRHAGLLKTYAGRSAAELQKGITRLEGRAAEHAAKAANPAQFAERWGQMSAQEQAGLVRYWQKEAANYGEQAEVLRGLLGSL